MVMASAAPGTNTSSDEIENILQGHVIVVIWSWSCDCRCWGMAMWRFVGKGMAMAVIVGCLHDSHEMIALHLVLGARHMMVHAPLEHYLCMMYAGSRTARSDSTTSGRPPREVHEARSSSDDSWRDAAVVWCDAATAPRLLSAAVAVLVAAPAAEDPVLEKWRWYGRDSCR